MANVPDWIQASVATVAIVSGATGAYSVLKSDINLLNSNVNDIKVEIRKGADYDAILTGELDALNSKVIKNEANLDFLAKGQAELALSIKELTKQITLMNENLVKIIVKQEVQDANSKKEKD